MGVVTKAACNNGAYSKLNDLALPFSSWKMAGGDGDRKVPHRSATSSASPFSSGKMTGGDGNVPRHPDLFPSSPFSSEKIVSTATFSTAQTCSLPRHFPRGKWHRHRRQRPPPPRPVPCLAIFLGENGIDGNVPRRSAPFPFLAI